MRKVMYAVLKLSTSVDANNPLTGQVQTEKINGIAGFIPVYENEDEAIKATDNGKYQILAIKLR